MKMRRAMVLAAALFVASMAKSGHELPVYPSYYPHEIEIKTIAPGEAADLMRAGNLHAYVGTAPDFAGNTPKTIDAIELLGSLIVIRLNPGSPLAKENACATSAAIVHDLAARTGIAGFTFHPYPVTPWHGDYLHHVDRAEHARERVLGGKTAAPDDIRIRVDSVLAENLIRAEWRSDGPRWDAAVETIDIAGLVADASTAMNGWLEPRWSRSGWFHAYRVLGGSLRDPAANQEVQAVVARLQAADYQTAVDRINLEREVVQSLTSGCHALVAGYTAKREFFNADFSAGIENLSFDALEGFSSPMFLRTVKLKDYPWNGSLRLGIAASPESAWNPVAGFSDPFGRLAWYALADPAAVPSPYEAGWTLNRISEVEISPRQ